jgi:hypothetical protein
MSRKRFTPEEITGKLYEAEVHYNGFKVLIFEGKRGSQNKFKPLRN